MKKTLGILGIFVLVTGFFVPNMTFSEKYDYEISSFDSAIVYMSSHTRITSNPGEQGTIVSVPDTEKIHPRDTKKIGFLIKEFLNESLELFKEQRAETINIIKQCQTELRSTDIAQRDDVRERCHQQIDESEKKYSEVREIYYNLFAEYKGVEMKILRDSVRGDGVSKAQQENAMKAIESKFLDNKDIQERLQKHMKQ